MTRDEIESILDRKAKELGVDREVISAIITVESDWRPWSVRSENGFGYFSNVVTNAARSSVTADTERTMQRMSFGLMQLMGATARTIGYQLPLAQLLDPETNLEWGCKYWLHLMGHYPLVTDRIAAYNAGVPRRDVSGLYINQDYVSRVLAAMKAS